MNTIKQNSGQQWNRLAREMVQYLFLEVFKTKLDKTMVYQI